MAIGGWICACDQSTGVITSVRLQEDGGKWRDATRAEVVRLVDGGVEIRTWYKAVGEIEYKNGAKVESVPVNGKKYLRTDANKTAQDNLGSLPPMSKAPF